MIDRRPTPHDTPDSSTPNSVLHYVGLALIALVVIALIAYLVG